MPLLIDLLCLLKTNRIWIGDTTMREVNWEFFCSIVKIRMVMGHTVSAVRWPRGILAIVVKTLSHGKTIFLRLFFLCSVRKKTWKLVWLFIFRTKNIIFGTLKIGQNDPKIPSLEFENHGFLEKQVFLPTEVAGTNIFWMIYQHINCNICLSLFGWKENILHKQHIVQWTSQDYQIHELELEADFFLQSFLWCPSDL